MEHLGSGLWLVTPVYYVTTPVMQLAMDELLNPVSIVSLISTAIAAVIAVGFAALLGKTCSTSDKLALVWLLWDLMIHCCLEGPFVYFSLTGSVSRSSHWLAEPWKEYAKVDKRWGVLDPTIVSMELLVVVVDIPLCVALIYAIVTRQHYRHWLQITLCVSELIGGWMTFVPEWVVGSPNLVTDNWLYLWVYLVFFNGLWVLVPLLLLYQSWHAMRSTGLVSKAGTRSGGGEPSAAKQKTPSAKPRYFTRASKNKSKHA